MTVHREADLGQQMLAPIVSETGNAGDHALGRGKERLLEGCSWVRQFDVIPDKDGFTLLAVPGPRQGPWSPREEDRQSWWSFAKIGWS